MAKIPWRFGPRRTILWRLVYAASLAAVGQAQRPPSADAPRPLPNGIWISSLGGHMGAYSVRAPGLGRDVSLKPLWLTQGGAAADVAWRVPSPRSEFSGNYQAGYTYNPRFSNLSGVDQALELALRTQASTRAIFTLSASGESRLISGALFEPSSVLTRSRQLQTPDDLVGDFADSAAVGFSSLDYALFGARRYSATCEIGFHFSHTPRLASHLSVAGSRLLRANAEDPQVASRFPAVTLGAASVGLSYSVSRRSRIRTGGTFTRVYSEQRRSHFETVTLGWERAIGRRSFGYLEGGYGRITDQSFGGHVRHGYSAGGALGTTKGYHTVTLFARRTVADLRGIGAGHTITSVGAWSWSPTRIPWSAAGSAGYERLTGGTLARYQTWVGQFNLTRRLASQFFLAFEIAYATDAGRDLVSLTSRGARISLIWRQAPELGRPQ